MTFTDAGPDHKHFGADAVVVLVREKLTNLVETKDLATLSQLEACLGGQVLTANQKLASFTPAAACVNPLASSCTYWADSCSRLRGAATSLLGAVIVARVKNALARLVGKFRR